MKITPFTPPPYDYIAHGVFPKPIGEEVYAQWNKKLAREEVLVTERIIYEVDGLEVSGVRVMPNDMSFPRRRESQEAGSDVEADPRLRGDDSKGGKARNDDASYPLILFNRGGSGGYGMITSLQIAYLMHPMAKFWDGAIVLGSQYRGNDMDGVLDKRLDEFGGADVADLLALIEEGKKLPQWDGKNIFIAGWSRGGLMAARAMKLGAKLNAVSTVGGAFDLMDMLKREGMRGTYDRRIGIQDEAQLMDALRERSAVCWPEAISAPIQIQHGDADDQVNIQCARTLAEQLSERNHPHELIEYAGGDHYLNRKRDEVLENILRWFSEYKE